METNDKIAIFIAFASLLSACSKGQHNENSETAKDVVVHMSAPPSSGSHDFKVSLEAITTNDSVSYLSSYAVVEQTHDTADKFIRTANINFRVKNVVSATYRIEDLVRHFGGIVTYTGLHSTVDNTTVIPVSADSSLESTYYTLNNGLTLRIPHGNLDTVLKSLAPLVDFFNYRIIKAENVKFDIYANVLEQERLEKHNERLAKAVGSHPNRLSDATEAENDILDKEEQKDNTRLRNYKIQDSINYSVVTLYIYQRESCKRTLVANDKNIDAYTPGFFSRLGSALKSGWNMLLNIIVGLAGVWTILLILGVIAYIVYKLIKKKPNQ